MGDFSQELFFGAGSLAELFSLVTGRVLVVTDGGIVRAGHVERVLQGLAEAEAVEEVQVYEEVQENPTESEVARCAEFARAMNPDVVVGLGGGSALDTAKGILFLLSGGGVMSDYEGRGRGRGAMLPFVAIPTTAGTGSECQSFAILSRDGSGEKMACGDVRALAKVVILDPELTESMPLEVARLTALDALSHAVESVVCRVRTEESQGYACEAFRRMEPVMEAVLRGEASLAQRGEMLIGAALAGRAIEASMLGAAHAMANPLTANFGLAHGRAVMTVLPEVMRWNEGEVGAIYERLRPNLVEWVEGLRALVEWEPVEVEVGKIEQLAVEAARQWTGKFNPRALGVGDFKRLYERALTGV